MEEHETTPIRISFDPINRGFYCPTCLHGTYNKAHVCDCGQVLLNAYACFDEDSLKGGEVK